MPRLIPALLLVLLLGVSPQAHARRTLAIAVLDLPASGPEPSAERTQESNLEALAGHLNAESVPATGYVGPRGASDDALAPWTRVGLPVSTGEPAVTAPTADHRFAAWYTGSESARDAVAALYLAHVEACLMGREAEARRRFGHETPVILSIHANELNADRMADLLTVLEARGYSLVPVDEATAELPRHAAGRQPPSASDPCGERWFEAHWRPRLDAISAVAR
ncbi:MAG: hypothetical protein H6744_01725 [Deltaproteobacteria bacterium]|nr:hypothetical protein [Deltaproteobacteria bacterium]MCB9785387.1 hypothetical protein [Deltaproteobacteria bacterium]